MAINLAVCLSATLLASQLFFSSRIVREGIALLTASIQGWVAHPLVFLLTESNLRAAILVFILGFTLLNLMRGASENIKNIYYLCILLILPEVTAHSRFEWVRVLLGLNIYSPSRSFLETLFTCLITVGGYLFLTVDSDQRHTNSSMLIRGAPVADVDNVYFNQSMISLSLVVLSFFFTLMLSFTVQVLQGSLHQIISLANLNYIIFGIVSSILLVSTLYVSLRENADSTRGAPKRPVSDAGNRP